MTQWILRRSEKKDAASLTELSKNTFLETFGHLYTPENRDAFIASTYTRDIQEKEITDTANHTHFLAEAEGKAVGFVKFGTYKLPLQVAEFPVMELHRLYVLKAHQGEGIGKALMNEAMRYFEEAKIQAAYLGVWENNFRAQKFYGTYGFSPVGEYKFYVGNHADRELILKREFA